MQREAPALHNQILAVAGHKVRNALVMRMLLDVDVPNRHPWRVSPGRDRSGAGGGASVTVVVGTKG